MFARPVNQKKPQQTFTHTQISPAMTWEIVHNLARSIAAVRLVDETGATIIGDVTDIDINTTQVTFTSPVSGRAFIS